MAETAKQESGKLPENTTVRLRSLAHDLSNSIETILQASYLLGQLNLDANGKKWAHLIDTATQDAASTRTALRNQPSNFAVIVMFAFRSLETGQPLLALSAAF